MKNDELIQSQMEQAKEKNEFIVILEQRLADTGLGSGVSAQVGIEDSGSSCSSCGDYEHSGL